MTENGYWVNLQEPKKLGAFGYENLDPAVKSFKDLVPENATKIRVVLLLRTGNQQGGVFWTKISTKDGDEHFVHWTYGQRYPQSAISYNSETIEIPCAHVKQFMVQSNHVQPKNCHYMNFQLVGFYLPKQRWHYFEEPKSILSFGYSSLDKQFRSFKDLVPENAKKVKLILFLRTGNQLQSVFWTKFHLKNGEEDFVHWTFAQRYPQAAISFNSETIEVPCQHSKEFCVHSNHVQQKNSHHMRFYLVGYYA